MTITTVAGETEPRDFQLTSNGQNLDGTGYTVGMLLPDGKPAPTVVWLNQAGGTVRVTGIETWTVGKTLFRFTLTDGTGKVGYCPNGSAACLWVVKKALSA